MPDKNCATEWSKLLLCTILTVLLTFSRFTVAGENDKNERANQQAKFFARSELVLIPVLVTDKSGGPVVGMKKEEFTVLENGTGRNIASFEEITSDSQRSLRPANPNEFTNSLARSGSAHRMTLIVLDLINTPFLDQAYARQELLKYLSQSLDQREPTGLFTLTRSGLHIIHDFTTDPRVLQAALRRIKGDALHLVDTPEDIEAVTGSATPDDSERMDSRAAQTEADKLQSMMKEAELNFQSVQQRFAIIYTLQGLQQIAQTLTGVPGRKSLIWAGGGFPFSVSDTTMQLAPAGRDSLADVMPLYERTLQLLNDAQIALYPVDVKGLQGNTPSSTISRVGGNYVRMRTWSHLDTQTGMQTFASATGGRAYYNSNDLVKGFREAVRDSTHYYVLGYYLDRSDTKLGWRKLAVKVKRDHVEVRARSGFFVTHATLDPSVSRDSDVSTALQSPVDYLALPLVLHWGTVEASRNPAKKRVRYFVDLAPDPTLIDVADNNHVALEFAAVARTLEGKQVGPPTAQTIDLHPTAEHLTTIREKGIGYHGALDLAPGEYSVRIVVRDDLSGRMGSVAAPLKVDQK